MSAITYKVSHPRGGNLIAAHSEVQTSEDGLRRVVSRNVKRSLGNRRFDSVRVATLKRREAGKWIVIATGRSPEEAEAFLKKDGK